MAGILLAITQPIRIGDSVTIEDETGRVDDLTLSYTYLDPGDGRLVVVPNEKVVTSIVFNRSTGDRSAPAPSSVWVPPGGRPRPARAALEAAEIRPSTSPRSRPTGSASRSTAARPGAHPDRRRGGGAARAAPTRRCARPASSAEPVGG